MKDPEPSSDHFPSRTPYAPSITDLIAAFLIVAVPLRGALDPQDTAAHLRLGETILRTGQIPRVEQLSYTLEGQPLVLSGWLSDVAFAFAARLGGLGGVVLLTAVVLATAYGTLTLLLRGRGVDARLTLLAALFSLFLGTAGWSARPHIFSYLGTAILLFLLERRGRGKAWQYALLFLLWANLHAGFVYGIALVALFWLGARIEVGWGNAEVWKLAVGAYFRGLCTGLLATLVNPYGWRYYAQIGETLGDARLLAEVQEYAPPDLRQPEGIALFAAAAGLILLFALVPKRPPVPTLLATVAFLYAALLSQRHVPLFGLVVPPLGALFASEHRWRKHAGYLPGDHLARTEPRTAVGWTGGVVLALVTGLLYSGSPEASPLARFDPHAVPVAMVAEARKAGLRGRVFHDPNWGGYLLWAWPEKKAYITPLRYDLALVRSALTVNSAAPGWRDELDRRDVAVALVSPTSPLARALAEEPGWRLWERDSVAAVFRRVEGR